MKNEKVAFLPKKQSVLAIARAAVALHKGGDGGLVALDPRHGEKRKAERCFSLGDLIEVIEKGSFTGRTEEKPNFIPPNKTYTFRGEVDGTMLETCVYFMAPPDAIRPNGSVDISLLQMYFLTAYTKEVR